MSHPLVSTLRDFQDRLAARFGCTADARVEIVSAMLSRAPTESTSYWLLLTVSVGIATLGLALGSAAVIIGAMLVAPLMGPILGLGMGLATGSPFLVIRSTARITASVVVVIGGAALITRLLPFHEVTAEISSRASPTALDLLTAAFCAVAGVYATMRPGSASSATAAGTSISISLVPPLCASGFGVGTRGWVIARGAALLFTTNLVAIVVVSTIGFLAAGFNRIDLRIVEGEALGASRDAPFSIGAARYLARPFASRWGAALRFSMPFVLLAAVYIPLRRALNEVAWQVRVRSAVGDQVASIKLPVVETRVRVEQHAVEVVVVFVGTEPQAATLRKNLLDEIQREAGVAPRIEILAIPDATAFAGLESTLRTTPEPSLASAVPPAPDPRASLDVSRALVESSVEQLWPTQAAGKTLRIALDATGSVLRVRVVHFGASLDAAGREAVERALTVEMNRPVLLTADAIPSSVLAPTGDDFRFVAQLTRDADLASEVSSISICVTTPKEPETRAGRSQRRAMEEALDDVLGPGWREKSTPGDDWSVRFVEGICGAPSVSAAARASASTVR